MYKLPEYKAANEQEVFAFMQQHPFVTLIGCDAQLRPVATQVPVLIKEREGKLFLQGHVMRNTNHHRAFAQNKNVLALFTGAHSYVSASWYQNPQQGSTWNYMTVQASGILEFKDGDFLVEVLNETTAHFENNPTSPANFEHIPDDYINRLVKAILGFEIEVTSVEHVFKLSQDKDQESYKNVIEKLSKKDARAQEISKLMKERASIVFANNATNKVTH